MAPDPSLSCLHPEHVAAPPTWKPQVLHVLLAGLLCQHVAFFFSLRGGAFSLARAGLEQTGCCVGAQRVLCGRCPKGGRAVQGEGTSVQRASE